MENKKSRLEHEQENLVSVVMTSYNKQKFIGEQLHSIKYQTHKNWELIIADDCSTDDSDEAIQKFIKENKDHKIIYIKNNTNLGLVKNFENGLRYASGEYIAICDSDDIWLKDKLEKELQFLKDGNYGMVYSDLVVVDENLKVIKKSFLKNYLSPFSNQRNDTFNELINENHMVGSTILFDAKLKNVLMPFSRFGIHDHWVAIIFSIFSTIGYLDKPTVLYRQHSDNLIGANKYSIGRLLTKKNKIFLEKHSELKKNSLSFLKDLSNVAGIDDEILGIINKKIEKTQILVEYLSKVKSRKTIFWKCLFRLWKLNAFREMLQIIYFTIY
ncbi:MAG: glycosyltransferase family 2 protein [Candidatus Moranbacteria bacterium]|nr:glycosyltransferase family 2 protein [Candidatus Moranbacteria bacterium]